MLGLTGSLLGSVATGALGLFGQSSANKENEHLAKTRYQDSYGDMMKAGLNPAMMFGSGSAAPMPGIQSTMTVPAQAMKDAASSATQVMIANKTIDQLTEQIAKTNAETANVRAGTPGILARSNLDKIESDAVSSIPPKIRIPLIQAGFGAHTMRDTGSLGSGVGAATASAKGIYDGAQAIPEALRSRFGLSGPSVSSARDLINAWQKKSPALFDAIARHLKPYPRRNTTVVYKQ